MMFGADIESLRLLGQTLDDAGVRLATMRALLDVETAAVDWQGPDGEMFRAEWDSQHRPAVTAAADELVRVAEVVRRNADDQERTSSTLDAGSVGGSTGGAPGRPDGGSAGGDRSGDQGGDLPGDPDIGDFGDYEPVGEISLDDEALSPEQLNQQAIGDCWLLAGLGAVAHDDPDFLREHMVENEDGTWTVTMYKDGEPVEITVSPNVPSAGVMGGDGEPNWASIYEKAAAEYWGGDYENLVGGYSDEAFAAITGMETDRTGEQSLADVREALKDGPVAAGTEDDDAFWWWDEQVDDDRVVPNHAYVVDEVRENADGELEVHVINPWGPGDHVQGDGSNKMGDMWLTQQEWDENFDTLYTAQSTR